MAQSTTNAVSRRSFMKGTAVAGLGAAALGGTSLFGCAPKAEETELSNTGAATVPVDDKTTWGFCALNCHGRCSLKFHVTDDEVTWVESCGTADADFDEPQPRACLRGRTYRRWMNHPERLNYPMKRVGKRGEGAFEQISWDEATTIIADELRRIIDTYGNEAIYFPQMSGVATSMDSMGNNSLTRLMCMLGGYLGYYGDYSTGAAQFSAMYMYGINWYGLGSPLNVAEDANLILMFGNSLAETRQGGNIAHYDWTHLRENTKAKIYNIDPRMNSAMYGHSDEWIPINPGTDAALVAGLAHELIVNNWVDLDFLHEFCVGFDEETMPEAYKGKAMSYQDYVMGTGYDKVEKTPEWAAKITGIPAERIKSLAEELGTTSPVYIAQGWGIQRRSNGEHASWAIMTLPCLLGQVGLAGTNSGSREGKNGIMLGSVAAGENPVTTKIPIFSYITAIEDPDSMTATKAGVQGADKLSVGIKCIISWAGNALTNQHSDINHSHEVLADETKCEFILGIDTMLTDSMKYADILLPDLFPFEQVGMGNNGGVNAHIVASQPCTTPKFERKSCYEIASLIAEKMGIGEEYTQGKTADDLMREAYAATLEADPELPSYDEFMEQGVYVRKGEKTNPLAAYREDPVGAPLATPSGKIEIFSEKLLADVEGWEFQEDDTFADLGTPAPIPVYMPEWYGVETVTEEYPLMLSGFHGSARIHSSFGNVELLKELNPQELWINPSDAAERSIQQGDTVRVKNSFGEMELVAKVTPRIVAGTVACAQGAWHDADMNGDRVDKGGNINTLTTQRPTPVAKANPQHTNICQVTKA